MKKSNRHVFLAIYGLMIMTLSLICASPVQAQNWTRFQDEDNIFHALVPENYKLNKKMLRINDQHQLITTELNATVDQRPYKDLVKQYIIKYDQTFMNAIPQDDIPELVGKEMERYIRFYTKQDGVLRNREFGTFNGMPGGELFISYRDKEKGVQSIRVRFMYSDVSRIEQIIMGPEDAMTAQSTKDFYSSLRVNKGRTKFPGDVEKEWDSTISPLGLFTQLTPKQSEPYLGEPVNVVSNDRIERLSIKLHDPVYDNDMFYNVYGYRLNTLMTMENVQKVIIDRHLKKFKVDIASLKFAQTSAGDYPVLTTKAHFQAPEKYPYMNTISLQAHYYGNFVVVQELAGNNAHVESLLAKNLTRYFRFYPLRGHKKLMEERAGINRPITQTPTSPPETQAGDVQPQQVPLEDEPIEPSQVNSNSEQGLNEENSTSPENTSSETPPEEPALETSKPNPDNESAVEASSDNAIENDAAETDNIAAPDQKKEIMPLVPDGTIDSGAGE
jgi:hypothetical protein